MPARRRKKTWAERLGIADKPGWEEGWLGGCVRWLTENGTPAEKIIEEFVRTKTGCGRAVAEAYVAHMQATASGAAATASRRPASRVRRVKRGTRA